MTANIDAHGQTAEASSPKIIRDDIIRPEIICLGEPMVEFTRRAAAVGATQGEAPLYQQGFGGDTSNTAIAAARQGAAVGYITAVGADDFGSALLALWQREGIDTSQVLRDNAAKTGIYFITPHPSGRSFTYFREGSAASRMAPADMPADYIAGARILHVSAISQAISTSACDAVFRAIEIARAHRVLVSYDSNLRLNLWSLDRARAVTHEAMRLCDIALPSIDDSRELTGLQRADDIVDFYLKAGARVVALKRGAEGALIATSAKRAAIPPYPVTPVDATGAGDAFDGAFLAAYCKNGDPVAAARRAAVVAALTTCGYGALSSLPRVDEVDRRLAAWK
jgi:2-dehydro-3-deoxygluconokinase